MRRRLAPLMVVSLMATALGLSGGSAVAAAPTPQGDYRFNGNLRSSVHRQDAPRMSKVGADSEFQFGGGSNGYLEWEEGAGLKVNAGYLVGTTTDYTIALNVRLDTVTSYRKLVDTHNLTVDDGWYEYNGYLRPYDVSDPEPPEDPIQQDTFHLIVMTRAGGKAKGYVDGEMFFSDPDPGGRLVVGPDPVNRVLSFFIDNEGGDEESGGRVSRLRVWKNPLTNAQAQDL